MGIRDAGVGWRGGAAANFAVGTVEPEEQGLVEAVEAALLCGIGAALVGSKMGDLAFSIGGEAKRAAAPPVPNLVRTGRGMKLEDGLVIAIEPMLIPGGKDDYNLDEDEWTLRSANGRRAAHSEHTIAITAEGPS